MNEFASTQDTGLLKDAYPEDSSPIQEALKKKRKKLAETKIGLSDTTEEEGLTNG
jgi:hypothetical protein